MTDIFALAERRLEWIDQRQRVVAQNIANADTPNYQAKDITPFDRLMQDQGVAPVRTSPLHLAGGAEQASLKQDIPTERAPDGNAVSVEAQLTNVAQDETNASLVGNLWKTYMGMYMTALGHNG